MPASGKFADEYSKPQDNAMAAHGIVTAEQKAAFLAQISVESD
jgi:predicted chitinase